MNQLLHELHWYHHQVFDAVDQFVGVGRWRFQYPTLDKLSHVLFYGVAMLVVGYVFTIRRRDDRLRSEWVMARFTKEDLQTWPVDQSWREPTDNGFLNKLKSELLSIEQRFRQAQAKGYQLPRVTFRSSLWSAIHGRPQIDDLRALQRRGEALCEQIDRVSTGRVHIEIEDSRDAIARLQLERAALSGSGEDVKGRQLAIDQEILRLKRVITDLDVFRGEWVKLRDEAAKWADKRKEREQAFEDVMANLELDTEAMIRGRFNPALRELAAVKWREKFTSQIRAMKNISRDEQDDLIEIFEHYAKKKTEAEKEETGRRRRRPSVYT